MNEILTPTNAENRSWLVPMPSDMAQAMGFEEGSRILLQFRDGNVSVEFLPPTPTEIKDWVKDYAEKNRGFLEEMKRIGD